jgi:hypothetical protein
MHVCALGTWV